MGFWLLPPFYFTGGLRYQEPEPPEAQPARKRLVNRHRNLLLQILHAFLANSGRILLDIGTNSSNVFVSCFSTRIK